MNHETQYRHTCQFCGETYFSKRPDSRFHSAACRQKWYRWRKRLPQHEEKAIHQLQLIAEYLTYDGSKALAAMALNHAATEIKEIFRLAGVKAIR